MTSRRQPLDLNIKTQSQITGEQDAIIKSIYGATKGNIQSKTVLDGAITKTPLTQSPNEIDGIIDGMSKDELRFNLKQIAQRISKIATRDEFILMMKEIDQTNYKNTRKLTKDDFERLSYDEIMKFARQQDISWITDKGWTQEDLEDFLDQNDRDRKDLPPGQMTLFDAMLEMSYYGIPDKDLKKIIDAIERPLGNEISPELIHRAQEHGLTAKQMERYIELSKKARANTPKGQLSSIDIKNKLDKAGFSPQEIDQLILSIQNQMLNPQENPENQTETTQQDDTEGLPRDDNIQYDNDGFIINF